MEGELRDDRWELIAPLLPSHKKRVRPRANDQGTLNGILWVLCSGARWKDLPHQYGSPLDWSQAFPSAGSGQALDGSFVPAKKGERISLMAGKAKEVSSTC
jgi:hypothetical protein